MDTKRFIVFSCTTKLKSNSLKVYCSNTHNKRRKEYLEKIQEVIGDKKLHHTRSFRYFVYFIYITNEEEFLLKLCNINKQAKLY